MSDKLVSLDEFLNARKDFVKSGDILVKGGRAASSWNRDSRSIRFTMSAEVEDRDRDIVMQAGLNTDNFALNPAAFFNHRSYDFPVGTWSDIQKVNGRPKRTEGTLTLVPEGTDEVADQLAKHIDAGSIRACSIGFVPKSVRRREVPEDKKDAPYYWPGYEVLEADLCECSPCTIPSNPAAIAKSAAKGDRLAREQIEEILDTWTKTSTGLLIPKSELEQYHQEATGNRTIVVVVGKDVDATAVEEAVNAALAKATPSQQAQEALEPDTSAQTETDNKGTEDDAGSQEEVTDPTVPELTKPEAKGILRRAFELLLGAEENEAQIEQALREKKLAEAEEIAAAAARKQAVSDELAALEERLRSKGLAA